MLSCVWGRRENLWEGGEFAVHYGVGGPRRFVCWGGFARGAGDIVSESRFDIDSDFFCAEMFRGAGVQLNLLKFGLNLNGVSKGLGV